jgi:hypothetical protein
MWRNLSRQRTHRNFDVSRCSVATGCGCGGGGGGDGYRTGVGPSVNFGGGPCSTPLRNRRGRRRVHARLCNTYVCIRSKYVYLNWPAVYRVIRLTPDTDFIGRPEGKRFRFRLVPITVLRARARVFPTSTYDAFFRDRRKSSAHQSYAPGTVTTVYECFKSGRAGANISRSRRRWIDDHRDFEWQTIAFPLVDRLKIFVGLVLNGSLGIHPATRRLQRRQRASGRSSSRVYKDTHTHARSHAYTHILSTVPELVCICIMYIRRCNIIKY